MRQRPSRARRWRASGVVLALAVASVLPLVATHVPAASAAPVELEAPDFASETYADPWDYDNVEDQNTDYTADAANVAVTGGALQFDAARGSSFSPVPSTPGSLANGRDGGALTIDTSRYTHLSFQMTQNSGAGAAALYWFTCRDMLASCAGGQTFRPVRGTHEYDIDLRAGSNIGTQLPWSGRMQAIMMIPLLDLTPGTRSHVSIDWMRLYAPTAGRPHADQPPGDYGTYTIAPLPRPVIDSPVPSDGADLATQQLGHPWDFTNPANAAGIGFYSAQVLGYDQRGMTAVNALPQYNDNRLQLPVQPFDANRFHNLSIDYTYDGPFDLRDAPGGGKMARLIWNVAGTPTPQDGDDILTFSQRNAEPIEIDLAHPYTPVLDVASRAPQVGWAGQTVTALRFDPNEDPSAAVWHLKSLHLREDPAALGSTSVKFHDDAWSPGTTADVLVGTSAPGSAYTTIANNVPVRQGSNSVTFSLGDLPPGAYHVEVVLHHAIGGGNALAFSSSVVRMSPGPVDPTGSVDGVSRAPGGLHVSGWAFDPSTSSPIAVRVLVDGQVAGTATAGAGRSDVAAIVPGAGPRSGYAVDVTAGAGSHTVCVVGVNVGSGADRQLGCVPVAVSGTAFGSFDRAVAIPGGIRVSGWALDPDTATPIPVHVYVGPAGTALTAGRVRNDVAAGFPGYGAQHGFSADLTVRRGTYPVCAYAIGTGGGDSALLGCRSVAVGQAAPVGSLDTVTRSGGSVRLQGWSLDADTADPTAVHVYVGPAGNATVADDERDDIAAAFPDYGGRHGFDVTVAAAPGSTVCAYGINDGDGGNSVLACRVV